MTAPDPDATGPDGVRPDPSARRADLPDDVDAAFASIVAGWAAEGAPRWPDEDTPGPPAASGTVTPPTPPRDPARPSSPDTPSPAARPRIDPPEPPEPPRRHVPPTPPEDEHYVPPEPPPLPRLGLSSLLGLALLVAGVVLLAVPGLLGGPVGLGIVPGLLAMTAGLGWLVFGLRRHREPDDGPDGGAVL